MITYGASDVPAILGEYDFIGDGSPYGQVAWAYVTRGDGVLATTRMKPSDPMRSGQITLPSGHRKRFETPVINARRETFEETGVYTLPLIGKRQMVGMSDKSIVLLRDKINVILQPDGRVWVNYTDSGKMYTGFVVGGLVPVTEPKERDPHNINPRYVPADMFFDGINFLPTQQVYAELMGSQIRGTELRGDHFAVDEADMSRFLDLEEPEEQSLAQFLNPFFK